jgi:hypothetical protein
MFKNLTPFSGIQLWEDPCLLGTNLVFILVKPCGGLAESAEVGTEQPRGIRIVDSLMGLGGEDQVVQLFDEFRGCIRRGQGLRRELPPRISLPVARGS